jgi:hypothetical protein
MSPKLKPLIYLAAAIGGIALIWGVGFLSLGYYSFFAPKQQAVERQVFENTPSAIRGSIQDIRRYYAEYLATQDPAQRAALAILITTAYDQIPPDRLSLEIQNIYDKVK